MKPFLSAVPNQWAERSGLRPDMGWVSPEWVLLQQA
jgi:hypothetical protein